VSVQEAHRHQGLLEDRVRHAALLLQVRACHCHRAQERLNWMRQLEQEWSQVHSQR
jgi:hypothetical protein